MAGIFGAIFSAIKNKRNANRGNEPEQRSFRDNAPQLQMQSQQPQQPAAQGLAPPQWQQPAPDNDPRNRYRRGLY